MISLSTLNFPHAAGNLTKNSFPYPETTEYKTLLSICWSFTHIVDNKVYVLGYLVPSIATALYSLPPEILDCLIIDDSARTISLKATTVESRSRTLATITAYWRLNNLFPVLQKWRDEHTPIYAPPGVLYATIERASTPLFGFISYYVYLIAYTYSRKSPIGFKQGSMEREMKVWIQRRALSKASHGGLLDCTVAGAIQARQTPIESLFRESEEEASLSSSVTARAKPVRPGDNKVLNMNISSSGVADGEMYYRPGCGFGFEIELTEEEVPLPSDGEVMEFYRLSVQDLKENLRRGEFMPHAAKVLVEWLVFKEEFSSEEGEVLRNLRKREFVFPLM